MKHNRFKAAVGFVISMMMVSTIAIVGLFAALIGAAPTYAAPPQIIESEDYLPMVAFEDNDLKIFGFGDTPQVIDSNTTPFMSNHVWSPDGNWLAYIREGLNGNELMLTDIFGRPPQVVATGVNSSLPIHFSIDNRQIFYTTIPNTEQANNLNTIDVMTLVMGSANPPAKLGSFQQASCGGTGAQFNDMLYWTEAGINGNRPIMEVTNYGVVHSINCEGIGVALLGLSTGVDTPLDNEISHVSLSADRKNLLGIKNNRIMIIDLATGQLSTFSTEATPDQVMWGAPDTSNIYYSVRTVTEESTSFTADEQAKILNATGLTIASLADNHISVHRLNLETDNDEIIYENTAYAIGHMSLLPDNRVVMISEVPSLTEWLNTVLESDNSKAPQLQTALYLVSLEGAETRLVGTGLTGARLNDDEYVRQFGIRPQVVAQPASVNIGAQIKLTGTNYPPQSRVLVYLGTNANDLDTEAYAAGFTDPQGEITLSFNMPAKRENGQSISSGQMLFIAKTADGLFSAQTQVTININTVVTPVVPVITRVPTNPSVPTPFFPASVSISPERGTVGTQININGRNFPVNKRVNIHLGTITSLTGNAVYASAFSDYNGNVSLTFNMPGVYANGTPIQSSQILIVAATDDFTSSSGLFFNFTPISQPVVIPSISLSPTTVKLKDTLTVSGSNFLPNTTVNLLMGPNANDLQGNYRTVTTDANGKFVTSFSMPNRWRNGDKIKGKQVIVIAAPYPTGTWSNPVTLGIKEPKKNDNTPTATPTDVPTDIPTEAPTDVPTDIPTEVPTDVPTDVPTEVPTDVPTEVPTVLPTDIPVELPTEEPTEVPTDDPVVQQQPTPVPVVQDPVVQQQPTPVPVVQEPAPPTPVVEEPVVVEPVVQNPVVQLTSNTVTIGASITVSGKHFPANSVLTVRLVGDVTTSLGLVNTNDNGSFTQDLIVPLQIEDSQSMMPGNYQLIVGNSDVSASTSIVVSG